MKKKKVFTIFACVLVAVVTVVVSLPKHHYDVGAFSLSMYYHPNEEVKVIENVGEIPDARTAVKKADEIWMKHLHANSIGRDEVSVYWDEAERCWMVWTNPPGPKVEEGVEEMALYELLYVIIRENGDVLKVGVS